MIYLDNAATSFPKPQSVTDEVLRCMQSYCGNAGRGSHRIAMEAAEKIFECRSEAASFFGLESPENVAFTMNTTMALNIAIKGFLKPGDHVLISDMEHNAVARPIHKLASRGLITYDVFSSMINDPQASPVRICAGIAKLARPQTKMLICSHMPNISSYQLPLARIGAFCRKHGILFVVDGAQSAGHLPINMKELQIDALCLPGHKGLLGVQGSGMLLLRDGLCADTLIEGGSGYHSLDREMPAEAPERYEAGTLSTPAIAGLCEGIKEIKRLGVEKISQHLSSLHLRLQRNLQQFSQITVYTPQYTGAVLLLNVEGIEADRLGAMLDQRGFCVRAGYHCAALGHQTLGTPQGGAVRVSAGIFNTPHHIDAFSNALEDILLKKRNNMLEF